MYMRRQRRAVAARDAAGSRPCPHSPVFSSGASSAVRQHAMPQHPKPMSVPGGNWTSVYAQQHFPTISQQPRSCDQQGSGSQLQQQGSHWRPTDPAQQQIFVDVVHTGSQHCEDVQDCSKQKHATHGDMFCFSSFSSTVDVMFHWRWERALVPGAITFDSWLDVYLESACTVRA